MSLAKMRNDGAKCRKKKENVLIQSSPCSSRGEMAAETSSKKSTHSSLLSTSFMVLPLETASVGSSSKGGPRFLETTGLPSDSKEMKQKKIQSKRCEENATLIQIYRQSRIALSAEVSSKTGRIEPDRNVEEVVDLTCEFPIVDLTQNESVVFVEEITQCQHHELRTQPLSASYTLCRDSEAEFKESDAPSSSRLSCQLGTETIGNSGSLGTVSCPICMDSYIEIMHSKRFIVSTKCGHIFCNQCLCSSLTSLNTCPSCRKKLGKNQYHPIYI